MRFKVVQTIFNFAEMRWPIIQMTLKEKKILFERFQNSSEHYLLPMNDFYIV